MPLDTVETLRGLQYMQLPKGLCPGLAENIFGQAGDREYAGIICVRTRASYLVLQKLIDYTVNGKAIWQIVSVKILGQPRTGELLISSGCADKRNNSQAVFALVKDNNIQPYQIIRAWKANLVAEQIQEILPQQVVCYNPFPIEQIDSDRDRPQSSNSGSKTQCHLSRQPRFRPL
jgi:hypothetical protein